MMIGKTLMAKLKPITLQHDRCNHDLQGECRTNDAQIDRPAIAGERERNCKDCDDPGYADVVGHGPPEYSYSWSG
jgi:hypothetical protein